MIDTNPRYVFESSDSDGHISLKKEGDVVFLSLSQGEREVGAGLSLQEADVIYKTLGLILNQIEEEKEAKLSIWDKLKRKK